MSATETPGASAGQYQQPPDEAVQFEQFKAAQAAQEVRDEAMRGNGSDNPLVRWLTRKPLPVKMTTNRVICGLIWAFWTLVLAIGVFAAPGAGAGFVCFVLAALAGYYDFRVWTRRATSLWFFIVF